MNAKNILAVSMIAVVSMSSAAQIALAQSWQDGASELCNGGDCPISTIGDIFDILAKIARYTYTIFFIVAVIFILIAAFSYLNAKGDPGKIADANKQIIWAVVAIIVALLSVGAAAIIENFIS